LIGHLGLVKVVADEMQVVVLAPAILRKTLVPCGASMLRRVALETLLKLKAGILRSGKAALPLKPSTCTPSASEMESALCHLS